MLRLWLLMRHFTRPSRPAEGNAPSWYTNEISRSHFVDHLTHEKHFLEDWRRTFRRWYYTIFGGPMTAKHSQKEVDRIHLQRKRINDLIDKALNKNLLIPRTASPRPAYSEVYLTTDWRGREFIKPIQFFNACLAEYDPFIRFALGGGFVALIFGVVWLFNFPNSL